MADNIIEHLRNKKILILGFGSEGKSSLNFINKHIEEINPQEIIIADLNPIDEIAFSNETKIKLIHGETYLDSIKEADIVLKSPGINFNMFNKVIVDGHYELLEYPGVEISGQMDLFLRYIKAKVIGVAGTKGKSTTTSLVYEIIKNCTNKYYLLGNIGIPVLDYFDQIDENSYCAIEMGVHQLEFCMAAPHVAIVTNLYPEHLDHYRDLADYANSKLNILRWQKQNDIAIIAGHEKMLVEWALPLIKGELILVNDELQENIANESELEKFNLVPKTVYGLNEEDLVINYGPKIKQYELHQNPHLLGRHNKLNIILAMAACAQYAISELEASKTVEEFSGLEHRLEYVGEFDDVIFYNDSIATIPAATKLALESLKDIGKVTTIMLGGLDRDLDYRDLVLTLYKFDIKTVICFPDTGIQIAELIKEYNNIQERRITAVVIEDMQEAVNFAFEITRKYEICLMSPAAASYNKYKNFAARGNAYKNAIKAHSSEI